jgi:hypothetical protein
MKVIAKPIWMLITAEGLHSLLRDIAEENGDVEGVTVTATTRTDDRKFEVIVQGKALNAVIQRYRGDGIKAKYDGI